MFVVKDHDECWLSKDLNEIAKVYDVDYQYLKARLSINKQITKLAKSGVHIYQFDYYMKNYMRYVPLADVKNALSFICRILKDKVSEGLIERIEETIMKF